MSTPLRRRRGVDNDWARDPQAEGHPGRRRIPSRMRDAHAPQAEEARPCTYHLQTGGYARVKNAIRIQPRCHQSTASNQDVRVKAYTR